MMTQKVVMTTCGVVIGYSRPMVLAKSIEVNLSRMRAPTRMPKTSDQDWIILDWWALVIYLTMREWRAIF